MAPDEIRIRADPIWQPARREEAPFLPLSADARADLRRIGEAIEFKTPGTEIYRADEAAAYLYLLTEGVAQSYRALPSGERQIVAFFWPGDILGLAEGGLYVNSCTALTPCHVYRFATDTLTAFLAAHPDVSASFYVKAVHDLRNAQRQLIMMGRLSVLRRLAAFLIDCAAHEAFYDARGRTLTLPMTRYDIGDYIGTSAEGVTRGLGRLEAMGLVRRVSPRTLELKPTELATLVDLADPPPSGVARMMPAQPRGRASKRRPRARSATQRRS